MIVRGFILPSRSIMVDPSIPPRYAGPRALAESLSAFAEPQEHCALVRLLGQIGKSLAQFRDHRGALQAKERVDLPLDFERRYVGTVGVLTRELVEHLPGSLVVGLAIQRETQIVLHV